MGPQPAPPPTPDPSAAAAAAAAAAGRRLARFGWCHLVPGGWACAWAWHLLFTTGGEPLNALRQPGHAIIWFAAIVWLAVLVVLAAGTTAVLAGAVKIHLGMAGSVAAAERGAATIAFMFVALEVGFWAFLACLVTVPGVYARGSGVRLPGGPGEWVPVLMLGLSALLLLQLSRARRAVPPLATPAAPPPLPPPLPGCRVPPPLPLPRRVLPV